MSSPDATEHHRKLACTLGLGAIVLLAGSMLIPTAAQIEVNRRTLPADGRATLTAALSHRNLWGRPATWAEQWLGRGGVQAEAPSALALTVLTAHDGALVVRAGHRPGQLVLQHPLADPVQVSVQQDPRDQDADGLPDASELLTEEDRSAFVRWFTTIAEAQSHRLDDAWARVHHDCAGLVRFAYREALKAHDDGWLKRRRFLSAINHPDVRAVRYPDLPFMGDLPFSKRGRAFAPELAPAEQFTAAPDAQTLWQANSRFVSRSVADARAGDLLFYRVPYGQHTRMHTMIILGETTGANHTAPGRRVVYHTGARAEDGGEVRQVSLQALASHPDMDWHPSPDNPRFLGVYRLNLIEHTPIAPAQPWTPVLATRLDAAPGDQR